MASDDETESERMKMNEEERKRRRREVDEEEEEEGKRREGRMEKCLIYWPTVEELVRTPYVYILSACSFLFVVRNTQVKQAWLFLAKVKHLRQCFSTP